MFLFISAVLSAEPGPPAPPPGGGGGGGGGVGPGGLASPVDMYVYVLGIVAILFIVYFTKKMPKKAI